MYEQLLSHLWEGRGYDAYPMIYKPTYGGRIVKQQLKSQLILVNFCFVLNQFQIKIANFYEVFPTCVQFFTQTVVLYYFRAFSEANIFSSPQKFVPHAQQQPIHRFTSNQKPIDLNDRRKLQSMPNKVSIFEQPFERSIYLLINLRSKRNNDIFIIG